MPFHAIPCHSMPFHTIPYHSMPFHAIPCHSSFSDGIITLRCTSGIICAVRDHFRSSYLEIISGLGTICNRRSFAALYRSTIIGKTNWSCILVWRDSKKASALEVINKTSSNHRLESAGLNALEQLLFLKYWIGNKEDGNTYLVLNAWQKIGVTFDSHQVKLSNSIFDPVAEEYLLKIEAKSFRDTGHCKDTESTGNLGLIAGF